MNILAIDASSRKISYSIVNNNQLLYEYNRVAEKGASLFVSKLKKTLKTVKMSINNFDFFVIGSGPGSFTGLRISFSIIKAFALAVNKPIFSQNSFSACAYPLRKNIKKIAVISDAKKNLIYAGFFTSTNNGFQEQAKPKLMKLEDCIKKRKNYFFVTYDSFLRKEAEKIDKNVRFCPTDIYPESRYLIDQIDLSKISYNLKKIKPLYLHPMDCQVRKRSKKNIL